MLANKRTGKMLSSRIFDFRLHQLSKRNIKRYLSNKENINNSLTFEQKIDNASYCCDYSHSDETRNDLYVLTIVLWKAVRCEFIRKSEFAENLFNRSNEILDSGSEKKWWNITPYMTTKWLVSALFSTRFPSELYRLFTISLTFSLLNFLQPRSNCT